MKQRTLWMIAPFLIQNWMGCHSPGATALFSEQKLVLADMQGVKREPLGAKDCKATVFVFITNDCPVSNGYAPEINRICAEYAPKRIAFYLVHVDPDLKPADAKKHAADYGYRCPVLLDPSHQLVKVTQVTVTPEAAVLSPDGKLLYRGRIDDSFVALGKKRAQPTTRDLRDALDAILLGKTVAIATTTAVGCYIPPAKGENR